MRAALPLLLVACLVQDADATLHTYRQIIAETYDTFDFVNGGTRATIMNKLQGLDLTPRLSFECPEDVCPNMQCPARSYNFFVANACRYYNTKGLFGQREQTVGDDEATFERAALALQNGNDETYIEYILVDAGLVNNAVVLSVRRDEAHNRLMAVDAFAQSSTRLISFLTGPPLNLVLPPVTPVPPSDDDSEFYEEFIWFWLIVLLVLLLCCLLLLLWWCNKQEKKKNGGNRSRDAYKEQPYYSNKGYNSSPYKEDKAEREARERAEREDEERERAKRTAVFKPGEKVEGFFDGEWYPATVQGGNNMQGYEIYWDDGSRSEGYLARDIRPYRVRTSEWEDARFAVGEPVVALSGGRYHSGWVYDMHDEDRTITVEKPDGTFRRVPETNVDYDPQGA
ncbi:hypothetical protein DIPPA_15022 [Diplonema papillatum]|nr:hypothetical protein DIPPA_15022 [Diplonema papillatum]|eukprot:gene20598-31715_t